MEPVRQRFRILLVAAFLALLTQSRSHAELIELAWDPPIPATNVASYSLHYGTASGQYTSVTNVGRATHFTLRGFLPGRRYYFAAATVNKQGRISRFSDELVVDVPENYRLPTISAITNLVLQRSQPSEVLPVHLVNGIGDGSNWFVTVSTSNPLLLPLDRITLAGTGTNRSLQLTPLSGKIGIAILNLAVHDGQQTNRTALAVSVTDVNQAPIVDAGLGTTVRTNLSFMLRGRAMDDGLPLNPGRLQVQWSKVSGPGVVTFGNSNYALTTIRFSSPGLYRLRLTAFDGELTASSETVIRAQLISDTTPPTISDLTVTDLTPSSVTLSWSTDEPADDQVKYTTIGETIPKFSLLNQTPKLLHTATVTDLRPGTEYTFYARSRDAGGNQTFSDPVLVETLQEVLLVSEIGIPANNAATPSGYAFDRNDLATDGPEMIPFDLYAPLSDTYRVWVQLSAPDDIYQPFSVFMDSGTWDSFDPPEGSWGQSPEWILLNGRGEGAPLTLAPRTFELTGGRHTLYVAGKQARSSVTRVAVSNNPDFVPVEGGPCCPTSDESALPQLSLVVRSGWSMIACPLEAEFPTVAGLLPNPPPGTLFFRYDKEAGQFIQNQYDGQSWDDPGMAMHAGTGGLLYNPSEAFTWILRGQVMSALSSSVSGLRIGQNFLSLATPRGGLLTKVLAGFSFRAGDTVQRMTSDNGTYRTYSFDGRRWDVVPVIDVGEAIFVNLVDR